MNCKSCGAFYEDHFERCPYCNAMNPIASLKGIRLRLYKIKEKLSHLVDETYASMNELLIYAFKRAFLLVIICIMVGVLIGLVKPDSYEHYRQEYNEELAQDLLVYDALIEDLNKAYDQKDFETIKQIIENDYSAFSRWSHYDIYLLMREAEYLKSQIDYDSIDEYSLLNALYYLYKPSYYTRIDFDEAEIALYDEYKAPALEILMSYGFDERSGHILYQNSLVDGFLSLEKIEEVLP